MIRIIPCYPNIQTFIDKKRGRPHIHQGAVYLCACLLTAYTQGRLRVVGSGIVSLVKPLYPAGMYLVLFIVVYPDKQQPALIVLKGIKVFLLFYLIKGALGAFIVL